MRKLSSVCVCVLTIEARRLAAGRNRSELGVLETQALLSQVRSGIKMCLFSLLCIQAALLGPTVFDLEEKCAQPLGALNG